MKTIIGRIRTAPLLAVLIALAAGGAMAFTPTVAWDGDFDTTTKTGTDGATYTFALNPSGNSGESINVVSGGNLVIGSDSTYGGVISWPVDLSSATKMSVLIKYSSLDVTDKGKAVLATATSYQIKAATPNNRTGIDDCVSMYAANGNKLTGRWNNNDGTYGGELANIVAPSGYLLMVYQSGSAFQFWTSRDGVTWSGGTATSLTFSDTYPNAVGLGGMTGLATATPSRFPKMSGMTIEAVAIYRGVALTVAQARNCHFDSEYTTQNYKKWAYANSVLSYNMANNADIGSSTTAVKCFNIATGANVGSDYYGGKDTNYFGSWFWHSFCCHQSAYSAPGCVLRVAGAHAVSAGFNKSNQGPLTLGGLIVERSADGCTFPGDAQSTVLGSASASSETWFGIKGNATINRNGFLILSGNVNIDVAEGKTFSLNASQTTDANYPTIKANVTAGLTGTGDNGGVLRMHGLGTITVPTLIASNEATLDFSDVQASETVVRGTTPFIQGNLTVDATTKFVFPSGTTEDAAYVLCSGTLTAPTKTVQTTVQVGDGEEFTAYITYNATTKSVSYSLSAPSYTGTVSDSTITWNADDLTNEDIESANITLTGSGEVTLPAEPISINAGSDVTVDVTGYTTAAYSGEGTFKYTSGYPTTVPAGITYWYVGSDDSSNPTAIANVSVRGSLKMSGYASLTGYSQTTTGSLDIVGGATSLEGSSCALHGDVTVRADATFTFGASDMPDYEDTSFNLYVYGTLNCGSTRQSINGSMSLTFYTGATITGAGDGNTSGNDSTFDFFVANANTRFALVDGTESGTVNFNAPISMRGVNVTWTIESGVTVDWAGDTTKGCTSPSASNCTGALLKAGAGTLKLSGVMNKGSVTLNAGTLDVAATQAVAVTYGAASAAMTASSSAVVTGTITAAANGSAFIAPDTSMQTFLKDSTKWQGTFAIPSCSSTSSGHLQLPLHNYGNASSVIALAGVSNQSSSYGTWISGGNDTINATVQLNGNVTFNQGSSGKTYTFKKITGTGNLTIAAFSGCTADGLGYVFDEINGYTGTITANNNSSTEACTFSVKIKNIVSSTTPLVKLTVGGTNEKTTIDLSEATVGGESVAVGLATVDGVSGIYRAVTFSEVEFDYYAGYARAKSVSATVTGTPGENTAWTLTVGDVAYTGGVYDSATGKVTWTPENGIANLAAGQALSYSIAATGGSMGTLADQQTTVGNVVDGWIAEDATHSATGTWSPSAPVFGEADRAALSGETTFTANSQASGKVTLTTVVKFGNEADSTIEIGADAKAAIKVENNSFKIWTKTTSEGGTGATADWLTVSGATPNLETDSTVVFTFDTDAKTFTVSVGGAALYYGESDAKTSFAFASDGVAISSVAYKGAGSFTSLTGAYATTDVTTSVDGKQVVVANSFISGNAALRAMTVAEAAAALAPDATLESNPAAFAAGGNGLNYFKCYALGLDPTKADDKPIVDVTTDTEGKFVFTVKHRNAAGELVAITPADNVSTTVKLMYGTGAASLSGSATGAAISPAAMFSQEGLNGSNVIYYKAEVKIGAK